MNKMTKLVKIILILIFHNSIVNKKINNHLNKITTKKNSINHQDGKNTKGKVQLYNNPNRIFRSIKIKISKNIRRITNQIIKKSYLKIKIKSLKNYTCWMIISQK